MNFIAFIIGLFFIGLGIWSLVNPSYEEKIYQKNYPKTLLNLNPKYAKMRRIRMTGIALIIVGLLAILFSFV